MWERERATWPNGEMSRFVTAGGLRWHVQQGGTGPAMLLIHGTGASTHSWRRLMPLLAARHTVLAIDLPGHGFTDRASGGQSSIAGMSAAVAALLTELRFSPVYGVGHSAGAVVLCRMCLDGHVTPRLIVSLNGAFLPLAGAAGVFFAPIAKLLAGASLVPRFVAWSAGSAAQVARVIAATGSRLDAEGVELYARLVRRPRHVAGALDMMGNWDLYSFERDLMRLATPLALVVAENDRTVPPDQAQSVARSIAGTQIHRLPGLGHLAHEEAPERVAGLIERLCGAQ